MITSTASAGDLIILNPASGSNFGHFKVTHSVGDASTATIFANKSLAIAGGGLKPNNIFIWDDHDGTTGRRDHPLFHKGHPTTQNATTNYRQFLFNVTYHRHRTENANYMNAITKEDLSGGTALNCILDFNGGDFSWRYDNGSSTNYRNSFKHCTFLNYSGVDNPYSGQSARVRVIDCAFEGSSGISSAATSFGTNQENVNFDDWTYDNYTTKNIETTSAIANGTYGHLKDLHNVTSTNTLFNTYQSAN